MSTTVLNPNHEASQNLDDMWPAMVIIMMRKQGLSTLCITTEDLDNFCSDVSIGVMQDDEGLHFTLMSMEHGRALAKLEGGLPN